MVHDPCLHSFAELTGSALLLGGSFDPVQTAHVAVMRRVLSAADLRGATGVFIPASKNPLKTSTPWASAADRVNMLRRALNTEPDMYFCELELKRTKAAPSYTIDTLEEVRAAAPQLTLNLLMGADAARTLPRWQRVQDIFAIVARVIVVARPGTDVSFLDELEVALGQSIGARLRADFVTDTAYGISSTAVRDGIAHGRDMRAFLHPAVAAYIEDRRLYRSAS